jgi:hypothetical protein
MPNPWVSLRHDQLTPVNKALKETEQLEKRLEEQEKTFMECKKLRLALIGTK